MEIVLDEIMNIMELIQESIFSTLNNKVLPYINFMIQLLCGWTHSFQ
jgi:hypothetical protein